MEVEFNAGLTGNTPVSQPPVRREPAQSAVSAMSFDHTQALEETLKETPTVRPEAVNRAAALLADPSYPPDDLMDRVANTLAKNITAPQQS
ncbi:MAG TPA: hypothetical protein VH280_05920 [Verrucomicrobiae bacterium]|jgi:hypothetical protein|nr:hypothetical protein [Verrucomicrobiae bacterium]